MVRPGAFDRLLVSRIKDFHLEVKGCMPQVYSEDLIQDTLEAALKSWDTWDCTCKLDTWLLGIYKYKVLTSYKKANLHNRFILYKTHLDPDEATYNPSEEITEYKFNPRWLEVCFHCESEVIKMYLRGKMIREIASHLGKQSNTVKSQKVKGIEKMREIAIKEYEAL